MTKGIGPKGQQKVSATMREYAAGTLHSGSKSGPLVKNPAQAKAIALSQGHKAAHSARKR